MTVRDQDKTDTFETETEMFKIEIKTFLKTLHICASVCFKATTMMQFIHLVFNNLNKHHKSSWHNQKFSYYNFQQFNRTAVSFTL